MAKIKIKTSKDTITVKCKLEKYEGIDARDIKIFEKSLLRGLVRPCIEEDTKISYTIGAGYSLEEFLSAGITKNDFFLILVQALEMIKKVEQNSFNVHNLMLNLKDVYINTVTKEVNFVYLPIVNCGKTVNLFSFVYDLLYTSVFEWQENIAEVNELALFIHGMSYFSAEDIEEYILQIYPEVYKQVKRGKPGQSRVLNSKQWETESNTAVLQPSEMPKSYLIRMNTQERAEISKDVFKIGKDYRYVDFPVAGNSAVSRIHANILKRDEKYYIQDNHSTNKTYVNGIAVQSEQEVGITDGDKIILADEPFEFRIEK